jgi:hypothetical protein
MGYGGTDPAPDSIKLAAKEMAAPLEAADRAKAASKAAMLTSKNTVVVIDAPVAHGEGLGQAANQEAVAETA